MRLRRAAVTVVAAVAGLAGLTAAVGLLLPRGHVETRSRVLDAAPDAVFAAAVAALAPPFEVAEQAPPRRLVTRVADPDLPYGGTWTLELEQAGTGTRVTITERGEIYNPVFRALARFVFGYAATMEAHLDELERRVR